MVRVTSVSQGHIHQWSPKMKFTSTNFKHRHRADVLLGIARRVHKQGHAHILFGKKTL